MIVLVLVENFIFLNVQVLSMKNPIATGTWERIFQPFRPDRHDMYSSR